MKLLSRSKDGAAVKTTDVPERKAPFVNEHPRKCSDGVYVGDQVYSTRRVPSDILWMVGTVKALQSTDLIEVEWNARAFDPHGEIFPIGGKPHRQWHDRAGMAHTHCRKT